jgi:26S proteasome regulatory subunit N7
VLEVIHEIPQMQQFVGGLYECRYDVFFGALAEVEAYLKHDRFLHAHYRWYLREMRIRAYAQLLESYRALSLQSMAQSFGVSVDFIDRDLSKFIADGRLNCVIDKVAGVVETNRPDSKNAQYQAAIKQGDLLLNRVQKLSRVINV